MKRPEILFDSNFIADRYFSIKSHRFRGMDIYKDKGKVFPLLAPVRQHLESLQDPRFSRPPSITPSVAFRPKKAAIQPVFMSSFPKRVKKYKYKGSIKEAPVDEEELALQQMYFLMQQEYPEEIEGQVLDQVQQEGSENKDTAVAADLVKKPSQEKPEEENEEEEIVEEEEEPEESEDSPKKKRRNRKKKKEKKNEEDEGFIQLFNTEVPPVAEEEAPRRRKLTAQEMVNKYKETIRMLESPSDIYLRMAEKTITRNRNGSEHDKNEQNRNKQKLEKIMKKIDVKVQVGSQGSFLDNKTNKTLTEMKRVPIEYFRRLRNDKSRSRGHNLSADMDVQNLSQIFFNFDSQKNIEYPRDVTLAHINTTLAEEIFTENVSQQKRRPSIISRLQNNSVNKKVSAWELVKCQEDPFLSPLHNRYQTSANYNSTLASTHVINSKTRNDSLNQSFLIRTPHHMTSTIYKSGRSRSEITAEKNRNWLSSRVSQLAFEVEDLHNQTSMDIGRLRECKKALAEDVRKIGARKLGLRGEEEEMDQHHYEDALKVMKQKLQREYPSTMNFGKGFLKNKRDRDVDNVKFEKNLAKVEKKIVERSKVKASLLNSRRPDSSKVNLVSSSKIESTHGDL